HSHPSTTPSTAPSLFAPYNHSTPPVISPLSLPDALPICPLFIAITTIPGAARSRIASAAIASIFFSIRETSNPKLAPPAYCILVCSVLFDPCVMARPPNRSEEHTSELQSRENLVCRLLLEKKKKYKQRCSKLNYYREIHE